jgi:hypothetical protein
MTDAQIAAFMGALAVCYFSGLKIGQFVKLIKGLGEGV